MQSSGSERPDTKARAIEKALARLGEPITEAQAKAIAALEDCDCKDGMFALAATRRQLFAGTGLVAAQSPTDVRKTVTILFADVVGSTRLGEQTDPESTRRMLSRYFDGDPWVKRESPTSSIDPRVTKAVRARGL